MQVAEPEPHAGVEPSAHAIVLPEQVGVPVVQVGGLASWVPGQSASTVHVAGGDETGLQGSAQPAGAGARLPFELTALHPPPESAVVPARLVMKGFALCRLNAFTQTPWFASAEFVSQTDRGSSAAHVAFVVQGVPAPGVADWVLALVTYVSCSNVPSALRR